MAVTPRQGSKQGPVLFPVWTYATATVKDLVSSWRTDQAASPRDRAAGGIADFRKSRVPGDLLRRRPFLRGLRPGVCRTANGKGSAWPDCDGERRRCRDPCRNSQV